MIGTVIKRIRKNMNQTQKEFGESIGVTQSCISSIERNNSYPSMSILKKIAEQTRVQLPVLIWAGMDISDVSKEYQKQFSILKPVIDTSLSLALDDKVVFRINDDPSLFCVGEHITA